MQKKCRYRLIKLVWLLLSVVGMVAIDKVYANFLVDKLRADVEHLQAQNDKQMQLFKLKHILRKLSSVANLKDKPWSNVHKNLTQIINEAKEENVEVPDALVAIITNGKEESQRGKIQEAIEYHLEKVVEARDEIMEQINNVTNFSQRKGKSNRKVSIGQMLLKGFGFILLLFVGCLLVLLGTFFLFQQSRQTSHRKQKGFLSSKKNT